MDDQRSRILPLPTHLLQRILRYSTLKIQQIFSQHEKPGLSARWRFRNVHTRVALVSAQSSQISFNCGTLLACVDDNHRILSFSRNHIFTESKAFCTRTGRIVDLNDCQDGITASVYCPKGFITGWQDGSVVFPHSTRHFGNDQITVIATFTDRVFTGNENGDCLEWTVTGELIRTVFTASAAITSITASLDGSIIAIGSANGDIIMVPNGNEQILMNNAEAVAFAIAMNDKYIFTGHEDGRIRVWTTKDLKLRRVIPSGGVITAISVEDDLLSLGTASGLIELYNWQTGEFVRSFPNEHRQMVTKIMITGQGELIVSASLDGQVISRQIC